MRKREIYVICPANKIYGIYVHMKSIRLLRKREIFVLGPANKINRF